MTATCSITIWAYGLFLWIELESGSSGPSNMWLLSRVTPVGYHSLPQRLFIQTWRNMTHQKCPTAVERNGEKGVLLLFFFKNVHCPRICIKVLLFLLQGRGGVAIRLSDLGGVQWANTPQFLAPFTGEGTSSSQFFSAITK